MAEKTRNVRKASIEWTGMFDIIGPRERACRSSGMVLPRLPRHRARCLADSHRIMPNACFATHFHQPGIGYC